MPARRLHPIAALGIAAALAACSPQTDKHAAASAATPATNGQTVKLLNVSYDVARDFYKDYNPLFEKNMLPNIPVAASKSSNPTAAPASRRWPWPTACRPMWSP